MYADEKAVLLPKSLTTLQKKKILTIILKYVNFTIDESSLNKNIKKFLIRFHTVERGQFKTSYSERKQKFFDFLKSIRDDSIIVNLPKQMQKSKVLFENIFQSVVSFAFREVNSFLL